MEKIAGYDEAVALTGEYEVLEPEGYICKVISAKVETSQNGNEMLVIAFDVETGEHKGIYKRRFDEAVKANNDPNTKIKWPNNGIHRIMLNNDKAAGFLKGFMTSVESSNSNFKWDWDEKKLKDKLFGGIFGEEEYEKNDGSIGTSTKLRWIRSVQAIEDGKYKIPDPKKLNKSNVNSPFNEDDDDDDLPF
ncbi:MAG: hypothetical protein J6K45_06405 [Clostridia bacterium]|nr:hypothetical protein [Clostridia bacterium]